MDDSEGSNLKPLETGIGRRRFLTVASLSAAWPLMPGTSFAAALDQAPLGQAPAKKTPKPPKSLPMSVGYIEGSDAPERLDKFVRRLTKELTHTPKKKDGPAPLRVIPAASLEVGDASLMGRPLRVRVLGLYPAVPAANRSPANLPATAIDLDMVFPPPGPWIEDVLTFQAWSFRGARGWNASPPVRFQFPSDWMKPPVFTLKVTATNGKTSLFRADFALDVDAGQPKLRQGIYLLGLTASAWNAPRTTAQLTPARASLLMVLEPQPAAG